MSGLHCLTEVDDEHTCMLPAGHDEPHEPTSNEHIIITRVDDGITIRVDETA